MENVAVLQSDSIHNKSIKFGIVLCVIIQFNTALARLIWRQEGLLDEVIYPLTPGTIGMNLCCYSAYSNLPSAEEPVVIIIAVGAWERLRGRIPIGSVLWRRSGRRGEDGVSTLPHAGVATTHSVLQVPGLQCLLARLSELVVQLDGGQPVREGRGEQIAAAMTSALDEGVGAEILEA